MSDAPDRIEQLILRRLAAGQADATPAGDDGGAVDYDWQALQRYGRRQLAELEHFAANLADGAATALAALLAADQPLQVDSVTQHYDKDFPAAAEQDKWRFFAIGDGGATGGLLSLEAATAGAWVSALLGGGQAEGGEGPKELSAMETAVLLDIAATIAGPLAALLRAAGARVLVLSDRADASPDDLAGESADGQRGEYVTIALRRGEEGPAKVLCTIPCDAADAFACPSLAKAAASRQAPRQLITAAVERVPVAATVRLGSPVLSVRDMVDLEEGDVVLLGRPARDSAELIVQGRVLAIGQPARVGKDCAIQISRVSKGAPRPEQGG